MERLTMGNGLCKMASTEFCFSQKDCYSCEHGRKIFKRLAAYEDTGLEPEEIDSAFIHEVLEENKRIKTELQALQGYNDPLTMEELREMDGEPVWVVNSEMFHDIGFFDEWALIHSAPQFAESTRTVYRFEFYGQSWTAYRRKPEEGRHENTDA